MANVLGMGIIIGLIVFIVAMVVGIVKRVREIQKKKKEKAQSTTQNEVCEPNAVEDKNNKKGVSE